MGEDEETQLQEIEALESIFGADEFKVLSKGYPKISLTVKIGTELSTTLAQDHFKTSTLSHSIRFYFDESYPTNAPLRFEFEEESEDQASNENEEVRKFWASTRAIIGEELELVSSENLGMPAVYTLISAFQESLQDKCERWARGVMKRDEERQAAIEREEQARFEGTRVTVETFAKWQKAFLEELAAKKGKNKKAEQSDQQRRMTGKEMFLSGDNSLDLSDLQFLTIAAANSAGNNQAAIDDVGEFDESLFQDDLNYVPSSSDEDD